ncbi:MAG TPA: hypothetical protein PKH77_03985 [Anaerolineae bacterium]|nr:hypothetical protein [Anaerolineae bacterium]
MKISQWLRKSALLLLLPLILGAGFPEHTRQIGLAAPAAPQARTAPLIIDHTSTAITAVPEEWIVAAKQQLHIGYGHTSHGSQISDGMSGLVGFANGGGQGLELPEDIFRFSHSGNQGGEYLHLFEGDGYGEGDLDHDAGYYPRWVNETRAYLGAADTNGRGSNHPEMNVIMWSWCGQVSGYSEQDMIDNYLAPMTQLELDYPGITFVYMTGHSDGSGEEGNLHQRNEQIREYCRANNKVLFDFNDFELYDPDGNYYGDKNVDDACNYDSDGNGSRDKNWAVDWQNSHTEGVDWYDCGCAHSDQAPLNCNRKAYGIWALWASLAGWNGGMSGIEGAKIASQATAFPDDVVTYTVTLHAAGTPPTGTASIQDVLPTGLTYVPGSLSATSGNVNDADAPTLAWSGALTPTTAVTVTYAATVATHEWRSISNAAVMQVEGVAPITRTATVQIVRPEDYPDLTPSFKTVSQPAARFGDVVTYTVGIRNATGPISVAATMSDRLPRGLAYVAGSLAASSGVVDDSAAPLLAWSGVLSPTAAITVTYAAKVTFVDESITIILPATHHNTAVIAAPGYQTVTRTVTLKADWKQIYLPLVLRAH